MYEFINEVTKEVSKLLGDDYNVFSNQVEKKNGTIYESIIIMDKNEKSNTTPTIYLEKYFEMYEEGMDLSDIAYEIIDCYEKHKNERFDVESFMNFEIIKDYICYELINTEKNKHLLEDIPHRDFFDLSICYFVKANDFLGDSENFAGITIHNNHMEKIWGVTEEDLFNLACINTPRLLGASLKGMNQIFDDAGLPYNDGPEYFYILSNKFRIRGASAILYSLPILTEISKAYKESLWVIPSSVHEWFITFDNPDCMYEDLVETIETVNEYELANEEVLGCHPYFFSKDTLTLSLNKED